MGKHDEAKRQFRQALKRLHEYDAKCQKQGMHDANDPTYLRLNAEVNRLEKKVPWYLR